MFWSIFFLFHICAKQHKKKQMFSCITYIDKRQIFPRIDFNAVSNKVNGQLLQVPLVSHTFLVNAFTCMHLSNASIQRGFKDLHFLIKTLFQLMHKTACLLTQFMSWKLSLDHFVNKATFRFFKHRHEAGMNNKAQTRRAA